MDLQASLTSLISSLEGKTGMMKEAGEPVRQAFEALLGHLRPNASAPDIVDARTWYEALSTQAVQQAVLAIQAANNYRPFIGPNSIAVHNDQIAALMRDRYSSGEFHALLELCHQHNVFQLEVNSQTGLVCTSGCPENWDMHGRTWVHDSVSVQSLQRQSHPQAAVQALLTLARFYCTEAEQNEIALTIADRNYFLERNGLEEEVWLKHGVAHVFVAGSPVDPNALTRDPGWFNHKRLGSHGLALAEFCQEILRGALANRQRSASDEAIIVDAIASLAAYLSALNTDPRTGIPDFQACSAGNWEELPFPGGLTSDIESMRLGFEYLHYLLSDPELAGNAIVARIRRQLQLHKYGTFLQDLPQIEALVNTAAAKIIERLLLGSQPQEHPIRPDDASLVFISTSSIHLAEDPWEDAAAHFKVLDHASSCLLRESGMIRYAPFKMPLTEGGTFPAADSYLAYNFWLPEALRCWIVGVAANNRSATSGGSTDTSTESGFVDRQKLMPTGTEAQWFMVSEAAAGYALWTTRLLSEIIRRRTAPNSNEQKLIDHGVLQAHNLINRAFARITHSGAEIVYKSNGLPCLPWAVPEAMECVSSGRGGHTLLPGVNTPLAWAQASLSHAAQAFKEMLFILEQLRQVYPAIG